MRKTFLDDQCDRSMSMPSGYKQALQQVTQMVDAWDRRYISIWKILRHSLLAKSSELPSDQITNDLLQATKVLAHRLQNMAQQVSNLASKVEKAACRLENALREAG